MSNKIIIDNIEELGYKNALLKVFDVKRNRYKVYGNTWKEQEDWELVAAIKQKYGRLKDFIIDKKDSSLYENEIDTLIDLINYSLFLLENKLENKQENKK